MSMLYLVGVVLAGFLIGLLIAIMELNEYIKESIDDSPVKAFIYVSMIGSICGSFATVAICLGALTVIGIKYSIDHKDDEKSSCDDDCDCNKKE